MSDLDEMYNPGQQAAQPVHDQSALQDELDDQQGRSPKDRAMDQARKRLDADGDDQMDDDETKKMGEDAINKVKGLFKKD